MNPFLLNDYVSPVYFCDRQNETKALISNVHNKSHTAFFAQRRLGKTALIKHTFYQLEKKKIACIYLDIYASLNLKDFANALANSIYQVFPETKSTGKRFWEFIKLFRPVITVDALTGFPQLSLDISQPKQIETTIPQLLQFLDSQNIPVVIAIDEFQQVLSYPEKNVEALLRSCILPLKNVTFIFCGSNHAMRQHIFNSAKRPFYASTKNINLQKIDRKAYEDFIKKHFADRKIKISKESVDLILELTSVHTYYTQRLCHDIFVTGEKNIQPKTVNATLHKILTENEGNYFQYRNFMTTSQWNLLRAIAKEEKVFQPYGKNFIFDYRLGTSATVKRSLESLLEKEIVFHNISVEKPYYEVEDKFLMRWLQKK